jgi:hypothetical protein
MIGIRHAPRYLPLLVGGLGAGVVLALLTRAHSTPPTSAPAMVVALLPFVLAIVTGVGTSTTV